MCEDAGSAVSASVYIYIYMRGQASHRSYLPRLAETIGKKAGYFEQKEED